MIQRLFTPERPSKLLLDFSSSQKRIILGNGASTQRDVLGAHHSTAFGGSGQKAGTPQMTIFNMSHLSLNVKIEGIFQPQVKYHAMSVKEGGKSSASF